MNEETISYVTKDGDSLDLICYDYYGKINIATLQKIMDLNPFISSHSPILEAGFFLRLPVEPEPGGGRAAVKLWN